jgi:DNA repair protein RadC
VWWSKRTGPPSKGGPEDGPEDGQEHGPAEKPRGFSEQVQPLAPRSPPPGFAEAAEAIAPLLSRRSALADDRRGGAPPPFPSTGPHGHRERMRDKLLERGADALADYELLEMLLFFAQPKGDTKPLAKSLINRFGSYARVISAPQRELFAMPGIGRHSVAAMKLVEGSLLRFARAEVIERPVLNNWDRLLDYLHAEVSRETIEQFRVLFLDTKNRLLADEAQARGTVNHTPVYPREVVKRALELHATALILVHNHPSGDPTPSDDDIEMTREVKRAAQALSIVLHDHLIVGNGRWTSLRQEGLL